MKNLSRSENPEIASVADEFNREVNQLSSASFGGQVIDDIILPLGEEVEIPHNLKVTPKYRIILRQSNGVYISDGETQWDDKRIYLKAELADASGGSATINWVTDSNFNTPPPEVLAGKTVKRVIRNATLSGSWGIDDPSNNSAIEMPTQANIAFSGGGGGSTVTEVRVSILILRR